MSDRSDLPGADNDAKARIAADAKIRKAEGICISAKLDKLPEKLKGVVGRSRKIGYLNFTQSPLLISER